MTSRRHLVPSRTRRRTVDVKDQRLCELEMAQTVLREKICSLEGTQRKLEESRGKFAALYDHSPIGYIVLDGKGRVSEANAAAVSLLGYDPSKRRYLPLTFKIHPADVQQFFEHLARCQNENESRVETELRLVRADGQSTSIQLVTAPFNKRGQSLFLTALVDLTERHQSELATAQANEFAQTIVDTIHEPLAVLDADLRIVSANRALAALFQRPEAMIKGVFFESLLNMWWSGNPLRDVLEKLFHGGPPLQDFELQTDTRLREQRIFLLNARLIGRRNGLDHAPCILVALEDITARRRAEQELRRVNEELEQRVAERTKELKASNEQMESFCYSIAHDLRAPLRSIAGFSELLGAQFGEAIGPQGADYAQRIRESAERMDALIQDLLNYGRLNTASLALGPVDLENVFGQVLALLEKEIEEKQATVLKKDPLPVVHGHQVVLQVMLTNLVSNALKFVAADVRPNVVIRYEDKGQSVRIWIEDNGIGIAPEDHNRIFGVFQRLHTSQAYPGTGIGLAIVRRGVDRMLGRAGVESVLGQGSRFWIELRKDSALGERVASRDASAQTKESASSSPPQSQPRLPGLTPEEIRQRRKRSGSQDVNPHIIPFPQKKSLPRSARKQAS